MLNVVYAGCRKKPIMLSVIVLNVGMLSVIASFLWLDFSKSLILIQFVVNHVNQYKLPVFHNNCRFKFYIVLNIRLVRKQLQNCFTSQTKEGLFVGIRCDLYYKHITIVNYDYRVTCK